MGEPMALRAAFGLLLVAVIGAAAWAAARGRPASGPATLRSHLHELRNRALTAVAAAGAGVLLVFSFRLGDPWWLPRPALHDTMAAQAFVLLARHVVPPGVELVVLRPLDGLTAEMAISTGLGLLLASPVIVWQVVRFLSPALRPRERRVLATAALPVVVMFAAGASFGVGWVAPVVFSALYGYADALGARPLVSVADVVTFSTGLGLLFGAAFQTPLAMAALSRAGVVPAARWASWWRHAVVAVLVLCALVIDGSIVTLAAVAAPLMALYGIGVAAAYAFSPASR